ncbi:MAG: hypothetical protein LBL35_03020 [Clostridiales bacterium]|jgi:hypothetical protein|nr:hypothetical protein [Clostridiales bacterium]
MRALSVLFASFLKVICVALIIASVSSPVRANDGANAYIDLFEKFTAAGESSLSGFNVLSGVTKREESAFDDVRAIVGVAPRDSVVTISVYKYNESYNANLPESVENEPFALTRSVSVVVGRSGFFSKMIAFNAGGNFILISAEKDGEKAGLTALINIKNIEIKKELEQGSILYGKSLLHKDKL